jgi:hypothetical protein
MSNPIERMPAATARSEPIAKLFAFKKIAQSARDRWSHLCAHGYTLVGGPRDDRLPAALTRQRVPNVKSEEGTGGWAWILSDIKSLLETGSSM